MMVHLLQAPPMPDYSRKRKEPVATIRMTTKTKLDKNGPCSEDNGLRSKIDPSKYLALLLGSSASLSDCFTPPLRQSPPHKPSDPLLQELSDVQLTSGSEQDSSGVWSSPRLSKNRTLGTRRSSTAPLLAANGRKLTLPRDCRPSSTGSGLLPTISTNALNKNKATHGYEINGVVDADATIVDADAVLDLGSESLTKDLEQGRSDTPPVPNLDVLSRRQLKLIGTNTEGTSNTSNNLTDVDKALSQLIISKETLSVPKEQEITPADLFEMVGKVGERMLVNRARLLLLQHETQYTNGENNVPTYTNLKPPTAPCGMARPSPLPSMLTIDSRMTVNERATTAPPIRSSVRKQMIRSSKLRSTSGCGTWSVPCKSVSKARAEKLREPFTILSINPTKARSPYPAPPPSESSVRTPCLSSESELSAPTLQTTPYFERCANYRDPLHTSREYSPLTEEHSLSETPLLQPAFSSLSSFLPSTPDLVK
ncbi:hypothetical protein ACHWQZ_G019172 [Mnemiopsis leidyi]